MVYAHHSPKEAAKVLDVGWCLMGLLIKAANDWRDIGRLSSYNACLVIYFLLVRSGVQAKQFDGKSKASK